MRKLAAGEGGCALTTLSIGSPEKPGSGHSSPDWGIPDPCLYGATHVPLLPAEEKAPARDSQRVVTHSRGTWWDSSNLPIPVPGQKARPTRGGAPEAHPETGVLKPQQPLQQDSLGRRVPGKAP